MGFHFRNRIFLVTGAAGGIGSHLSRAIAERGATVIAVDLNSDLVAQLARDLQGEHIGLGADLTDRTAVENLLAEVDRRFGRIDVLINNAGMTSAERFDERSVESIERELDVNLRAPLVLTRLAIPLLRKSTDPWILSTVSLGGIFPLGETPIYTTSKFGLRGAMLSLALDLQSKGFTVGSILPSATDTPMLQMEAIEGGNSLQFLDPPQTTQDVVDCYLAMLDSPRFERYPRPSESWLVRAVMVVPNLIPRLLPFFRGRGERGMERYLRDLERRGLAHKTDDGWSAR